MRAWKALLVLVLLPVLVVTADEVPVAAAPAFPPGFTHVPIATGFGEYELVNFEFLPSGEILAAGKCGGLRRVTLTGTSTALPSIPVYCNGDRGLLGIDLAPDFDTSRRVYTLYNYERAGQAWARLSYWTANDAVAPTALANEVVVLDDIPSFSSTGTACDDSHTIGTVVAALDGTLYIGNGDASSYCAVDQSALAAYDLSSPRGKILHVHPDGTGVATNPFYEAANPRSWRSRALVTGTRNPFRFDLRPGTDTLYIGDVGWTSNEEVDVARSTGGNLGWPCWEGPPDYRNGYAALSECAAAYGTMTPIAPLHSWPHGGGEAAAVGGTFYTGDTYPADYRGAYFFGDYAQSRIWTMRTDANDTMVRAPESGGFASDIGAPVAFRSGPGGDIFYADLLSANIYRIRYEAGNRAPVARITVDRTAGPTPLTVQFDGRTSYDLDGESLTYAWTFGDGTPGSTLPNPSHTYAANGSFTAQLTVTDQLGLQHTSSLLITPGNNQPVLNVQPPPPGTTFAVGDTLDISATATDVEDGPLPPSSITISTVQRHCPYGGSCHAHPGPLTGEQQSPGRLICVISDHGDDSYVEAIVTARDSRGATTTQVVRADPTYRNLTVQSSVGGVPIGVNASNSLSTPTFKLVVGSQNSVIAPAVYQDKVFLRWADGGPRERSVVMPNGDLTLTAIYSAPPVAVASATPASGPAPLTVGFSSAGSRDPDGGTVTYAWDFGDGSPASTSANPSHIYTSAGVHDATLTVTDDEGLSSQTTARVTVRGLVAGFAFDETTGNGASDASGRNNNGTLNAGVSRTASGHTRGALSFNGTDGAVTIPDADSLDLSTAFTLSAWVRPTTVTGWRTVVMKERTGELSYALYAGNQTGNASGWASVDGLNREATAPTALPTGTWTHVTTTYDGAALRTYVNGNLVATTAATGSIAISAGPLMIGGNSVWGEWFSGLIDDVRVYNRALSLTELTTDMATPVTANPATVPGAPTVVTAVAGNGAATVSWTAPASNGGSPITGYVVTPYVGFSPRPSVTFTSLATTQVMSGLVNGTTYRFRIQAINAIGTGASSTVSNPVTPAAPPGAPTVVTAVAGNGAATVSWTAPASNGGSPITGYVVTPYVGFSPRPSVTFTSLATTQVMSGLVNGTTYRFRIQAINAIGTGASSTVSNPVTPAAPPGAPTVVTAVAGNGAATVSWTAPASNGGSPITGYVVTPYVGFSPRPSVTFTSLATTQLVSGLVNGTTYRFRIQAINAIGTGASSTVSNPVSPSG